MDVLDVIRRQIERGEYHKARRVLISYLKQRPGSIPAWALLAGLISDPTQQAACYRRILDLDPANAQAAVALQRLTETSQQPGATLRCPQCGGKLVVHTLGDMKDKRATCQHCGTEMDLPDAYQRVEHQHEQERHSTHTRTVDRTVIETRDDYPGDPEADEPARQALDDWWASSRDRAVEPAVNITKEGPAEVASIEEKELRQWLQERRVPNADQITHRTQQLSTEEQVTLRTGQKDSQVRSWPGLLRWFRGGSRVTAQGSDTTSQQDESSLVLSPEELIEAAGGPLPPEERRKCPECGTTVPKQASRCGWCGLSFSES